MKRCTEEQLAYANVLLERHDRASSLQDVIIEIKPDLGEYEDFMTWLARQNVAKASEVIDILKDNLPPSAWTAGEWRKEF